MAADRLSEVAEVVKPLPDNSQAKTWSALSDPPEDLRIPVRQTALRRDGCMSQIPRHVSTVNERGFSVIEEEPDYCLIAGRDPWRRATVETDRDCARGRRRMHPGCGAAS